MGDSGRLNAPGGVEIDQFLSLAAHDLKQPLNVLQMYFGILQRRAALPRDDELGTVVQLSMRRMQSLLNLLSQWARAERGELKSLFERVPYASWLDRLSGLHTPKGEALQVTQRCPPAPEAAETQLIDLALLQQTLQDILHLLPESEPILLSTTGWQLEIECGSLYTHQEPGKGYHDALYQLAIDAGRTILGAMGLRLTLEVSAEDRGSRILLLPQA